MELYRKVISFFTPPENWKFAVLIIAAIFMGLGFFLLYISNASSYLSDKPETCINCHVMFPQYASWTHSSHGTVATCNDCHVPHNNVFNKYFFKAKDGLRHATVFTMRAEPQAIRIKEAGKYVVQENCKRCHEELISMVSLIEVNADNCLKGEGKLCWECHRETPHGTISSLSSTPYSLVPQLPSVVPDWIMKMGK